MKITRALRSIGVYLWRCSLLTVNITRSGIREWFIRIPALKGERNACNSRSIIHRLSVALTKSHSFPTNPATSRLFPQRKFAIPRKRFSIPQNQIRRRVQVKIENLVYDRFTWSPVSIIFSLCNLAKSTLKRIHDRQSQNKNSQPSSKRSLTNARYVRFEAHRCIVVAGGPIVLQKEKKEIPCIKP